MKAITEYFQSVSENDSRFNKNSQFLFEKNSSQTNSDRPPKPKPETLRDIWDSNHVRLPWSSKNLYPVHQLDGSVKLEKRWTMIERVLRHPIRNSQQFADAILSYNRRFTNQWNFAVWHEFCSVNLSDSQSSDALFSRILPRIVEIALNLPAIVTTPPRLLRANQNAPFSIHLSQLQVASLLANALFCTFPGRNNPFMSSSSSSFSSSSLGSSMNSTKLLEFPSINFQSLYNSGGGSDAERIKKLEKLKCLFAYFEAVTAPANQHCRRLTFTRQICREFPDWSNSPALISAIRQFQCFAHGRMEDDDEDNKDNVKDSEFVCENRLVDFADRFVGGGVLNSGCVQEEILFAICPELICSRLFTQALRPNEVLLVRGFERFSEYHGYRDDFRFTGPRIRGSSNYSSSSSNKNNSSSSTVSSSHSSYSNDSKRIKLSVGDDKNDDGDVIVVADDVATAKANRKTLIAMDAQNFSRNPMRQWLPECITQELNKAFVGFNAKLDDENESENNLNDDSESNESDQSGESGKKALPRRCRIVTGNWGCGVFRGDKSLKSVLQLLVCAQCDCNLAYYTCGDEWLQEQLMQLFNEMCAKSVSVSRVYRLILEFAAMRRQVSSPNQPILYSNADSNPHEKKFIDDDDDVEEETHSTEQQSSGRQQDSLFDFIRKNL